MKTWNDLIRRMCAQLLLAAAVLVFAAPPASAQDQRVRSDQEILMQLERDWDAAFLTRDVRVIDSILAEEFIATYDDGSRGDRAKELSLAAEFNQNIESSVLKEFTVKIYGDTAVVRGESQHSTRYTVTFINQAGIWKAVSMHSN